MTTATTSARRAKTIDRLARAATRSLTDAQVRRIASGSPHEIVLAVPDGETLDDQDLDRLRDRIHRLCVGLGRLRRAS